MAPLRIAMGGRLGWVAALASLGCGARSELFGPLSDTRVDAAADISRDAFDDPRDEPLPVVDTSVAEIAAENAGMRPGVSVSIRASTVLTLDDGTALGWGEGRWYELGARACVPTLDRTRTQA